MDESEELRKRMGTRARAIKREKRKDKSGRLVKIS